MKQLYIRYLMNKHLKLLVIILVAASVKTTAQQATVTKPFSVGRSSCGSGTHRVHFYDYNEGTNTISNTASPGTCTPALRIGATSFTFTSSLASVSYNPKDQNIYYLYTRLSPLRTYVWRWPVGTCPTSTSPRLDTLRSFAYDILGVAFDENGNGWMLEFGLAGPPYTAYLRSIDFVTGAIGAAKPLALTGGAQIYTTGTGDIAISPSGQMYFVVDNKLFTPDYTSYSSASPTMICTYIDSVRAPGGSLVGLTYAQGELIAAYSSSCRYREVNPLTGDTTLVTAPSGTQSTSDFASVISGVGASKRLVSYTPTGTANQYDVVYDIRVQNYGNYPLTNVQVNDSLRLINGIGNFSINSVSFISNPAGLVLNAGFNGNTNNNLLNGTGTLPAYPVANNFAVIRVSVRLSNIQTGRVYNNQAYAAATGFTGAALKDASTNGTAPDLNSNDKPDDPGESQPTPLLISVTPQTPPCASLSQVLYNETFGNGGNTTSLTVGGNTPATGYTGSTTAPLAIDRYMLTSNAQLGNNTNWISLTDHTSGSGRMMVVNADASNNVFFRDTIPVVCANQQYSLVFYAAFLGNSNYQTVCNGFGGFKYSKVMMNVRDATTGLIITQISTSDITSGSWTQYGLKFVMPSGFGSVVFELINDAQGGCGNDIAIDDIQFGTCDALPVVSVSAPSAGCLGSSTTFSSSLNDPGVIPGTKEYQWQISTDGTTWTNIASATSASYTINPVTATDAGKYYRVLVAAAGNIGTASCRYASNSFQLTAKASSTAPTGIVKSEIRTCPGEPVTLTLSGGSLGTNASWRWYSGSCGGTFVGTGTSISVNPTVTTTYYVRAEGDCNNTSCIAITVTVDCDIDDDNDGITDLAESGGVDPMDDHDSDGIENYRDAQYPGFTDSNGDGIHDGFDNDRDGIINALDLDSDNDGIPDVVEAGGVDANGDGRIDNYTDTDNDGLSQNVDANNSGHLSSGTGLGLPDLDGDGVPNMYDLDSDNDGIPDVVEARGVDANNDGRVDGYTDADGDGFSDNVDGDVGNDGVAENSANTLLRTGADTDADGRANSYPYKNFDSDLRADLYDLDSDNDGITDVREAGFTDTDSNGFADGPKGSDGWDDTRDALLILMVRNFDSDANPDYIDIDSDNDGIPDNIEGPSTSGYQFPLNLDSDGDGIDNRFDAVAGFGGNGVTPVDTDGDVSPDYIDTDSDGDTSPDILEGNDFNHNCDNDDEITLTGIDTDGDGLDDRFDNDNSSIRGTSQYLGAGGSFTGDATPGSTTAVGQCNIDGVDRDWRYMPYALEVNFLQFTGSRNKTSVQLRWVITCDKVIDHFEIERSTDGTNFKKVGIKEGIGAASNATPFTYSDDVSGLSSSSIYYRIKAVSKASSKRTQHIILQQEFETFVSMSPNPAITYFNVTLTSAAQNSVVVNVMDNTGRIVLQHKQTVNVGSNSFVVRGIEKLSPGIYHVQVNAGNEVTYKKLLIQK